MSLRDFNSSEDRPISLQNEPAGNGSGLSSFHTVNPEDVAPSNTPKIVGALAVALIVGAAGFGVYRFSGSSTKPVTMASNQQASEPATPAAAAPPPQQIADATKSAKAATSDPNSMRSAMGKTPSAMNNAPAPSAPVKTKMASAKPVRAALPGAASARRAAGSTQASLQPAVIPQPVSPMPSPSDVATTNTQSGAAVPQGAATASDIPAPPAQDQQPAAQPPAQSAGQVNQ
jgi:hypothetical protein